MLAGFRAARARCSRAFFVSAEVGGADAEICPDDPGDERHLVVRAGLGESRASPGPPGTSLICAPLGPRRRNVRRDEQRRLLGRESDLPCLWEAVGRWLLPVRPL
jgi:hypothetical protein